MRTSSEQRTPWTVGQALWVCVPLVSLGFVAWLPPLQTYLRTRAKQHLAVALAFAAGVVGLMVLFVLDNAAEAKQNAEQIAADERTPYGAPAGFLILTMTIAGVAFAVQLRPAAFGRVQVDPIADRTQRAKASALHARQRREEARELVASDPALARELFIGRPDVAHAYDDGGLIDLNHVAAAALTADLDWPPEQAAAVVAARKLIEGFSSLAEVGAVADVDQRLLDRDAARLVVIP